MQPSAAAFVATAESQAGDRYVYGAKEPASDPNPKKHGGAFDCSGLVSWAAHRLGVEFPEGSWNQLDWCVKRGTAINVDTAEKTAGALLFLGPGGSEHVVISRGDGTTIEARGAAYGVGSWSVYRDAWTAAALIPGIDYTDHGGPTPPRREAFVKRLQIAVGMKDRDVDGIWGPLTDGALARLRGHSSQTVARVQLVLRQVAPMLVPDGVWGTKTQTAYELARRRFFGHGL